MRRRYRQHNGLAAISLLSSASALAFLCGPGCFHGARGEPIHVGARELLPSLALGMRGEAIPARNGTFHVPLLLALNALDPIAVGHTGECSNVTRHANESGILTL